MHYLCDETQGWQPDIADLESKITERTKALVVINPNNPTGAVYSREVLEQIAELARKHQLLAARRRDLRQDPLRRRQAHQPWRPSPRTCCALTFNGLSKAYRVAGYRSGWLVITGPKDHASSFIEGINMLANMRLCPNVPAQYAIQVALGGHQSIDDLVLPGGRLLEQRDVAWTQARTRSPACPASSRRARSTRSRGWIPRCTTSRTTSNWFCDLLLQEKILVVQGTGFNWPNPDHLRVVTLPWSRDLANAIERLGNFLASYRQ